MNQYETERARLRRLVNAITSGTASDVEQAEATLLDAGLAVLRRMPVDHPVANAALEHAANELFALASAFRQRDRQAIAIEELPEEMRKVLAEMSEWPPHPPVAI